MLKDIYTFEVCFVSASDPTLQDELRSRFVRLLLYLHIDQGDIQKLTLPNNARVFSDISTGSRFPRTKGQIPISLENVKHFVHNFFKDLNGVMKRLQEQKNRLVKEVLTLTLFMVEYGLFVNEEELEGMIHPLVALLDGTCDRANDQSEVKEYTIQAPSLHRMVFNQSDPSLVDGKRQAQNERFEMKDGSQQVMDCKSKICSILLAIIDIRMDMRVSNFLICFREASIIKESEIIGTKYQTPTHTRLGSMEPLLPPSTSVNKARTQPLSRRSSVSHIRVSPMKKISPLSKPEDPRTWIEDVLRSTSLDIKEATSKSLIAVNIDMLLYKHPELINFAFTLLLRYHTQRHALLNALLAVQLLENDESIRALHILNSSLGELKTLAENAEFWLGREYEPGFSNPRVMESYSTDEQSMSAHKQVCQLMFAMAKLNFKEPNLTPEAAISDEPEFERVGPKSGSFRKSSESNRIDRQSSLYGIIYQTEDNKAMDPVVTSATEQPNKDFQRLLRNMRVYEPVLELVRHAGIDQFYSESRHQLVLRFCFVFLAKFCKGNPENQELLSHYVETFIEAMPRSVFAVTLIQGIYQDNFKLCQRVPIRLIRYLVKAIGDTPLCYKKCEIIRLLSIFIRVNGKILARNQIEVMSQLIGFEAENLKALYEAPNQLEELQRMTNSVIRQYVSSASQSAQRSISVPLEIQYLVEMLKIMALCCENKNSHAATIAQSLIPLSKLKELLATSSLLWPLKHALMRFFLTAYLDIEYYIQEDDGDVWAIIADVANDLTYIYDVYTRGGNQFNASVEKVRFELIDGVVEIVQAALSYVYEAVVPCLRQIFMKHGSNLSPNWSPDALKGLISKVCEFHRISPKIEFSRSSSEFLILIAEIDKLQGYLEGISAAELVRSKDALMKLGNSIIGKEAETGPGTKAAELRTLVKDLIDSDAVQDAVEIEFHDMVYSFMNCDKLTETAFGPEFILYPEEVYRALILMLDRNEVNLADELLERGLKLLRKSIELEVRGKRQPAAEWDTDDWEESASAICARQNMLADLGCCKLICTMISLKRDPGITCESILLAIALLLGGNRTAQSRFLECMQEDLKNQFVTELKKLLIVNFETTRAEQKLKLREFQYQLSIEPRLTSVSSINEESDTDYEAREDVQGQDEYVTDHEHYTAYRQLINILRFLQLLCEGHYRPMQDHLREQHIGDVLHGKSFDFVLHISGYLGHYIKILHIDNINLGFQLLDTLTEMVQGPCRGNQRILSQPKSIEQGRDLLLSLKLPDDRKLRGFENPNTYENISTLKSKTVNFLLSLLEGDADIEITRHISESLDFDMCKKRMLEVFTIFVKETLHMDFSSSILDSIDDSLEQDSFEGGVQEGFNLFILINKLADDYPEAQSYLTTSSFQSSEELLAFTFFKTHIARIEVLVNGRLQRIYFPIQPVCLYASDEGKDFIMLNVNRDSGSSKLTDLLVMADDQIAEMEHNYRLSRLRFRINSDGMLFMRKLCLVLALLINYLLLFQYDYTAEKANFLPHEYVVAIDIIGAVLIGLSSLIVIVWCVLRAKLVILKGWKERVAAAKAVSMANHYEEESIPLDVDPVDLPVKQTLSVLLTYGPDHPLFLQEGVRDFGNRTTSLVHKLICVWMVFTKGTFQYFIVYVLVTALGQWDVFFYSFLLLDVIYMYPTLHNVIKALTVNGNQILMTSLLGLVLIYLYSLWGFYINPAMYYDPAIGEFGETLCQSLWECFLTTFNHVRNHTGTKTDWRDRRHPGESALG